MPDAPCKYETYIFIPTLFTYIQASYKVSKAQQSCMQYVIASDGIVLSMTLSVYDIDASIRMTGILHLPQDYTSGESIIFSQRDTALET